MRYILKIIAYLVVLGAIALLGLAVFSELPAPSREVSQPIEAQ